MPLATAFRILDTSILLSGPEEPLRPVVAAYRRFVVPQESVEAPLRLEVDDACRKMQVDGRVCAIVEELDPTFQIYQEFLALVLQNVRSHAVLHGAVLADGADGCFIISAPSGHGKSTLALNLVDRGFGFMSDDYAPLNLSDGSVLPYPRLISVLPEGSERIPLRFRRAAENRSGPQLFGKRLLDVGDLLGESAWIQGPRPLRHVLLISGGERDGEPASTRLDVAARASAADELQSAMERIDGVEILRSEDRGYLRRWLLELGHARYPTPQIAKLMEHPDVILCEKHWVEQPNFDRSPQARTVRRREAASLLGRELLNRRGGGRLLEAYDGNVTGLFLDLAAALRGAECWRIDSGRLDETLALVERIVAPTDRDGEPA